MDITMDTILEVKDLEKAFKTKKVIKNLSFKVEKNAIYGFIGRNGAGKTTTMKMIMGFLDPDAGEILFQGKNIVKSVKSRGNRIGYLPDVPEFYDFYTPKQYLTFCGEISHMPCKECKRKVEELLKLVGLEKDRDRKIRGFSRGMKQRLGVAQALLNDPDLLICDEPTSALDPVGRKEILDLLSTIKERTTVIFSTHILSDVQRICDSVGILEDGKIVRSGRLEELGQVTGGGKIKVCCISQEENVKLLNESNAIPEIKKAYMEGEEIFIETENEEQIQTIFQWLGKQNYHVSTFRKIEKTLEDIYMEVVK